MSAIPARTARRGYTRIDWKTAARLLAEGRSAPEAASAIGIDEERLWRHLRRSLRFRHWLWQNVVRRRELAALQLGAAGPAAVLGRCLAPEGLAADAEMLALLAGDALQAQKADGPPAPSTAEQVEALGKVAAAPPPPDPDRAEKRRRRAERLAERLRRQAAAELLAREKQVQDRKEREQPAPAAAAASTGPQRDAAGQNGLQRDETDRNGTQRDGTARSGNGGVAQAGDDARPDPDWPPPSRYPQPWRYGSIVELPGPDNPRSRPSTAGG